VFPRGGVRERCSLQPPYGARDQTRSSEILVTSRPGAGIRRSDAAPPDSRCTSTKQKKSGAQAGSFFCGGGAGNRTRVLR
jgi:hypothetical protein